MEFRHVRYFLAVAQNLNFRRAAEQLRLAQPALSSQIRDLEEELGAKLFERTTRSVTITAAGQLFLQEALEIAEKLERIPQSVRSAQQGILGTLRIGLLTPAATPRLAAILSSFRQQYPHVQLVLSEMTSPEQMHRIREDQMDVGFMRPPTNSPDLEMLFVEKSEHVLAAPAGHRLTKLRRLEWGHFQDEKLVLIHPTLQHGFYDSFMELCARAGATPRVSQYANGVHTKMWLISAGFGVGPTSRSMSTVKRPGLVFKELPEGLPLIHTVLAWKRNNPSPTLKNFLNCFTGLDGKKQPRP